MRERGVAVGLGYYERWGVAVGQRYYTRGGCSCRAGILRDRVGVVCGLEDLEGRGAVRRLECQKADVG